MPPVKQAAGSPHFPPLQIVDIDISLGFVVY